MLRPPLEFCIAECVCYFVLESLEFREWWYHRALCFYEWYTRAFQRLIDVENFWENIGNEVGEINYKQYPHLAELR